MLRFRAAPNSRTTIVAEPSEEDIRTFVQRSKDKSLAETEVNRVVQALDLLQLPELQKAFSERTASNIISQQLRYKRLVESIKDNKEKQCLPQFNSFGLYERSAVDLKGIRRALELSIQNILRNPKAHLILELLDTNAVTYEFSAVQNIREQKVLLNIMETVGNLQKLSKELTKVSENFAWLNDQHQIYKLSDFTLLIIMHLKRSFHKLLDRYSNSNNYILKFAVVSEMEPLASFVASLSQGIRRYPKFYRQNVDATPSEQTEQKKHALVLHFSNGS